MPDLLKAAWKYVARNNGSPGVDGISVQQFKESPERLESFLAEIKQKLENNAYRPSPVKRVYIKKQNGKLRPLGIPTIEDRVVQTALTIILIPIFEQDFKDNSYGFRPNRGAHDALCKVHEHLRAGRTKVFDADISGYFDNIPHDKLLKALKVRIADNSVLKLIKMWLKCSMVETGVDGTQKRLKSIMGTPQGGVISPLLANIYLHWFDVIINGSAESKRGNIALVRYADDFVIMAKQWHDSISKSVKDELHGRFGLTLNEEKTRVINAAVTPLSFLGFTFSLNKDRYKEKCKYWHMEPSKGAILREFEKLRSLTSAKQRCLPIKALVETVNRQAIGWSNYFKLGNPSRVFRKVERYMRERIYLLLKRKSQRGFKFPDNKSSYDFMHEQLKLISFRTKRTKVV